MGALTTNDELTLALSLVSLLLALATAVYAYLNRKRDLPFDVASRAYDRYYEMNQIEIDNPHLTHMFVTFDRYEEIRAQVEAATPRLDAATAARYRLQERAVADLIFSFYEQMYKQWDSTRDKEHGFINEMILYFEGRLLRNQRIVWWWMEEAGGLETSYEDYTRQRFRTNILEPSMKREFWRDDRGPFQVRS